MKSAGPYIGRMSKVSRQFFFMASYDVDRFREFIRSEGFSYTYDVDAETMEELLTDDIALMEFGDRMVRQIMYAEETIPLKQDAIETHLANRGKYRESEKQLADDADRPSMTSYEMPLDGEEEDGKSGG